MGYMPNYMILGSLVLLPAFSDLTKFKQCGSLLKADCIEQYRKWPREWEDGENGDDTTTTEEEEEDGGRNNNNDKVVGLVVLTEIFAHELSFSYTRPWRRVVRYNGIKIRSLQHLQEMWSASCSAAATTTTTT